jgi:hypothetical protein
VRRKNSVRTSKRLGSCPARIARGEAGPTFQSEPAVLLTPSIDHLFDRGFIGFEDSGRLIISPVAHRPSLQRMGVHRASSQCGRLQCRAEEVLGLPSELRPAHGCQVGWIVITSAILPSPNRICKSADNRDSVNQTHLRRQTIPYTQYASAAWGAIVGVAAD